MGHVEYTTIVTLQAAAIGVVGDELTCRWEVHVFGPILGKLGPYLTDIPAVRLDDTHLECTTPPIGAYFVDRRNADWYLDTNATATVRVTKNKQAYSNILDFTFYSRPAVSSIAPKLGTVLGGK